MDLIQSLASAVGIQNEQAQALAGSFLGTVKETVKDKFSDNEADAIQDAVPEMSSWADKAKALLHEEDEPKEEEGGLLGGLLGGDTGNLLSSVAGAVGGEKARQTAIIVQLLDKFDVDASKAVLVAPVILDFLKDRLEPDLLKLVLDAVPVLSSRFGGEEEEEAAQEEESGLGDVVGTLGKLFG